MATDAFRENLLSLRLPEAIIECAMGDIVCPMEGFAATSGFFGYPPALTPIWSEGSCPQYWGYWKHWFVPRSPVYVKVSVECGMAFEIARTAEQFLCLAALRAVVEEDGVTPSIEAFADRAGITDLGRIDELTMKSGDDPQGFPELPQFAVATPLECLTAGAYDGDFPRGLSFDSTSRFDAVCEYELAPECLDEWPDGVERPLWLKTEGANKLPVFRGLLEAGNLGGAWLLLNSRGWKISEARRAMTELADVAQDRDFQRLAAAWLTASEGCDYGY